MTQRRKWWPGSPWRTYLSCKQPDGTLACVQMTEKINPDPESRDGGGHDHPDSEQPLRAWCANAKRADWKTPADVKTAYRNASFMANNRVVFNIKGNQYRLVVSIDYHYSVIYIRFVGTHHEYDKIDADTI